MAVSYVHPSVSSTITDNSTTYVTASGTTKLFAVFTAEKGEDNKIQTITSVSEFIFHYGEPNMTKYGQAAYNITNWLNAGGVAYCLRVLPEDAGYANAIVNIQTKVSSKEVLDVNGNKVIVDDVELRPCVTYTSVNNTSVTALEFNELRRSTLSTIDGYRNNMIFAVIPKGRGKGYNNLGFRFTLVDAYDSTYEFRLYNFEVTQVSETGSVSTIQGPFLVSLDPDAMSNSGSSLFIVDVIDSYCDYFSIIFNDKNYEILANIINPYVHPNKIDFFNGTSRLINGEFETYYDERTQKEEDIHMSIVKYVDGVSTDERNITDTTDSIEGAITLIDNAHRNEEYNRYVDSFDRAKTALGVIRKIQNGNATVAEYEAISLETIPNASLKTGIEVLTADSTVDDAYAVYEEDKNAMTADLSDDTYNNASVSMQKLSESVKTLLNQLYELFDYAKISQSKDPEYANRCVSILVDLEAIEASIKNASIVELNCNKYKNIITEMSKEYNNLNVSSIDNEKEEFIFDFIGKVEVIVESLKNVSDTTEEGSTFADAKLDEIIVSLDNIQSAYETLVDTYVTPEDYSVAVSSAWTEIAALLSADALYLAVNLALLEKKTEVYDSIKNVLANTKNNILGFITTIMKNIESFSYEEVKAAVMSIEVNAKEMSQNTYYTVLQSFDSYIPLLFGNDGSIEESFKDSNVEKLIIAGYKGTIDDSLTDKDQWPIDMVLDANYSTSIKNAIATLCTEIREDIMGILDTEFQASPADAISYRKNSIGFNSYRLAIFTQDFIVSDSEYTGNTIQVTPTYFLASKIPANDNANGIHWNFVGPRRGVITGYKSISFLPNPEWREQLYNAQVNYVQQDQVSTRFNSQLTSQMSITALSNISCVRTILRIQRDVENLMKNYQFEFNDDVTITNAQTALNAYLNQWVSNRACDTITGTVYASDYDRQQKLLRVKIELTFNSIIERIAIDLIVNS